MRRVLLALGRRIVVFRLRPVRLQPFLRPLLRLLLLLRFNTGQRLISRIYSRKRTIFEKNKISRDKKIEKYVICRLMTLITQHQLLG
jgi:hypothetical protein